MILDTVFAAADRSLWGRVGHWFTIPEYHELGRFTCDGVSLRASPRDRKGKWDSGLEMTARPLGDDEVEVKIKATAHNPRGNHDKFVKLHFDVLNGEDVVRSATMKPIKCPDRGDEEEGEVTITLQSNTLKADPITKLRITMLTVDY